MKKDKFYCLIKESFILNILPLEKITFKITMMNKYPCLFLLLLALWACQPNKDAQSTDELSDTTNNTLTEGTPTNQAVVNSSVKLPAHLAQAKQKSKYKDVEVVDLGKMVPCAFKGFQAVNEAAFKGLQLEQYLQKTMPDEATFKKNKHFYYAFQSNVNGHVVVILLSCMEGMSNEITGLMYNKKGQLLGNVSLAYNGADMDMVWSFKGQFKANGVYAYEYKKYLGTEKQICEWYNSQLTFTPKGNITFGDTVFKAKAAPQVPCYEKFRKKD
ncbi:hypothetical protein M23134_04155 [Microscilla marina ATCC 23134]|uniref:Uncharacterized protein n=2 Tax=Microscilla marina TaxID=1027 RepID=A1ZE14_MICM2|nr:hypothetical protein M23134_04155 [Microscilla marina ATCC 23134]